ncbi:MAG: acyl-CoA thioesterase [Clostridiales Family XIII bacterium]|jgi:acyl-CoA hydrolase|nr:acyl-CoA thioesterase [Clostridiales Family XIII bacterium]
MTQKTQLTLAQIMLPHQANLGGNVHGGEIFKLMDMTAGAVCQQYANTTIVTARVDDMRFTNPVYVGDHVRCTARIICVGSTSMDVLITVDAENLKTGEEWRKVASAFSTHVSIGGDGKPKKVAPLVIETEEQRNLFALAQKRRADYKSREQIDY